jgi:hypothetical protein
MEMQERARVAVIDVDKSVRDSVMTRLILARLRNF